MVLSKLYSSPVKAKSSVIGVSKEGNTGYLPGRKKIIKIML